VTRVDDPVAFYNLCEDEDESTGAISSLPGAAAASAQAATHRRRSKCLQDKAADADKGKGCTYVSMSEDLVKRVVESTKWWPEGMSGELEGVVWLMGGGRMKVQE
jgi:hypothetical protein